MTAERILAKLSLVAVALLLTAIAFVGGKSTTLGALVGNLALPSAVALPDWPGLSTIAGSEGRSVAIAFLSGWLLRWIYALPWGAIPRTILAWLLSWRSSVVMLAVATGCTAILLLY